VTDPFLLKPEISATHVMDQACAKPLTKGAPTKKPE
jgi:hypothetical protein